MRKILVLGLLFGTIAAWNTGCSGDDDDDDHEAPESITVTVTGGGAATVNVGSSLQLTATGNFAGGGTEDLTTESAWTSSSSGVATVGPATGLVDALAVGTTTITAEHDGVQGTLVVTVTSGAAATFDFTMSFSGWPHGDADSGTGVRVMHGGTRVYCEVFVNAGGTWTRTVPGLLEAGEDYVAEVFGDAGGGDNNEQFDNGQDHTWSFAINNVTSDFAPPAPGSFPHSTGQSAITWPNNTACP